MSIVTDVTPAGATRRGAPPRKIIVAAAVALLLVVIAVAAATRSGATRSDGFWTSATTSGSGSVGGTYDDLAAMAADAEVAVVGRIVALADGRPPVVFGAGAPPLPGNADLRSVFATVRVEEVARGAAAVGQELRVELPPFAGDASALPSEPTLFLLSDAAAVAQRQGATPAQVEAERGIYVAVHPAGVLYERDSALVTPFFDSPATIIDGLSSLAAAVSAVRG